MADTVRGAVAAAGGATARSDRQRCARPTRATPITDLGADALSRAIHARRGVVPRGDAGLPGAHRPAQPALQRHRQPGARRRRCCAQADERDRELARGRVARLAARHAAGDQGRGRRGGLSDHARPARCSPTRVPARRRPDGGAHEGGRLHRRRQDQHARADARLAHLQRAVRRHAATPGTPAAQRRRQQRRRGGGAGAAAAAGGRRQRLHGLAAQPGRLEQRVRPAAERRAGCRCGRRATSGSAPAGDRRPDGAQRARPGAAARRAGRPRRARAAVARDAPGTASSRRRGPASAGAGCAACASAGSATSAATSPIEPGVLDACEAALARLQAAGAAVEPIAARLRPRRRCGRPGWSGAARWSRRRWRRRWRCPARPRRAQARGAVGARRGAGPDGSADLHARERGAHRLPRAPARRCSSATTCWRCRPRRCGRSRSASAGRARSPAAPMDTYHRWMEATIYATFAGLPAISVPAGFDADGRWPMGTAADRPRRAATRRCCAPRRPTRRARRRLAGAASAAACRLTQRRPGRPGSLAQQDGSAAAGGGARRPTTAPPDQNL